jgi:hypothetical protein
MIEGFTKTVIRCNGVDLAVHRAGQGQAAALDPRVSAKSYVLGKRGAAIGAAA